MSINVEVAYSVPIYSVSEEPTEFSLELKNIHPQQLKWFNNCVEEFWKAQQWIAVEYRAVVKKTLEKYE